MEQVDAAMAGLDLFIGANLLLTNRTGHPAISLPSGFFESAPTGLQLTGKLFGEPELLLLAHAFPVQGTDHQPEASTALVRCGGREPTNQSVEHDGLSRVEPKVAEHSQEHAPAGSQEQQRQQRRPRHDLAQVDGHREG